MLKVDYQDITAIKRQVLTGLIDPKVPLSNGHSLLGEVLLQHEALRDEDENDEWATKLCGLVTFLIRHGADLDKCQLVGPFGCRETPLHHALRLCSPRLLKVLIDHGADLYGQRNGSEEEIPIELAYSTPKCLELIETSMEKKNHDARIKIINAGVQKTKVIIEEIRRSILRPKLMPVDLFTELYVARSIQEKLGQAIDVLKEADAEVFSDSPAKKRKM